MNPPSDPHKTLELEAFVEQMAAAVDLPIAPESKPGVVGNFARIAEIAQRLDELLLPPEVEAAPIFRP